MLAQVVVDKMESTVGEPEVFRFEYQSFFVFVNSLLGFEVGSRGWPMVRKGEEKVAGSRVVHGGA